MSPIIVGGGEGPAAPPPLQQGEQGQEGGHQQPKPHPAHLLGTNSHEKVVLLTERGRLLHMGKSHIAEENWRHSWVVCSFGVVL